jgi:hypothetical protein
MIDGLTATWVSRTDALTEIELTDPTAPDLDSQLRLRLILVVGPPDPNALSYLVPREVFERGQPVHVGALSADRDLLGGMLEILEVMNPQDVVVFICDTDSTLNAAIDQIEPQSRSPGGP